LLIILVFVLFLLYYVVIVLTLLAGRSDLRKDCSQSLSILYYSETELAFNENLQSFLQIWSSKFPAYVRYFKAQWLGTSWPPTTWARYAQAPNARSGDQTLEGYVE
jgi:hypothetical protein